MTDAMSNLRETVERVAAEIRSGPPAYLSDCYCWADDLTAALAKYAENRDEYCRTIAAMTAWLEKNQQDVFRRGLWDAMQTVKAKVTK